MKKESTKKLLIEAIKKLEDYKTELLLKDVIVKLEKLSHKKTIKKDKSGPKELIKKKMKYRVEKALRKEKDKK